MVKPHNEYAAKQEEVYTKAVFEQLPDVIFASEFDDFPGSPPAMVEIGNVKNEGDDFTVSVEIGHRRLEPG